MIGALRFGALAGALAVATSACGVGEAVRPRLFSADWQDDQGKSISEVHARVKAAQAATPSIDVVVAVAGPRADKLIGVPLAGGATWTFQHALDARPVIAEGGVVVGSGGGEIFALDAKTGRKLWTRPTGGLALLGAGDDGTVTAISLARSTGSTLLVVARDGSVKRQIETDKQIGDPAVIGGVIFVPWANQYVTALDVATGDELGRVTLRDKVSRAQTIGGGLYFGELAYVRFDEKIAQASRGGATRIAVAAREFPGTPRLLVPGTERLPPIANARDRDRLFARPSSPEGAISFDSGRFYATYFRLVFGFDASHAGLAWVHTHANDVIGGDAIPGGLVLCDESGKIVVLDARDGRVASERDLREPIRSCVVNADAFRAPESPNASAPLAAQIAAALTTRDATLAAAQRMLLRELAAQADESATQTLIEIAGSRGVPVLVTDARAALAKRRNGATFMLAALGKRYDFLRDVLVGPPVGPLADALAAMKETRAAPLLASHLVNPEATDDDVRRAAAALVILATKDELPALRQFFATFRATAATEDIARAVASVGEALLRLDPKDGRVLLELALKDTMTVAAARPRLEALLASPPPTAAPAAPEKSKK